MKASVDYLFQNRLIHFESLLLQKYLELRLDEVDLVLLLHLYEMEMNNEYFLSISDLTNKTTLQIDEVADKIDLLVTKGYISLEIVEHDGIADERFSIKPTLLLLIKQEPKIVKNTKALMDIMETELSRPLSSKELQIVDSWEYSVEQVKTAVLDALKQKKMGVEYVNKILQNNKKEVVKDLSYFDQFMND